MRYDIDAPNWSPYILHPCQIAMGALQQDQAPDDLTRAAMAGGGGWIYVFEGKFLIEDGDERIWLRTGQSLLYTNPTQVVLTYPEKVNCIRVALYGMESADILEQVIEHYGSYHSLPQSSDVVTKSKALYRLAKRKRFRSAHYWSTVFYEWLMFLCRSLETDAVTLAEKRQVVRNSRLLGSVHPSFKSYAKAMGYHPAYLSRTMKDSWGGVSPATIMRQNRLREAERLLISTNLSIREISQRVCYASPEAFSTAFRRHYDLSPLKYRHQYRMRT